MTDINIKIERYADKENLKKLMRYSKAKFATQSEVNDKFYTKEQVDKKISDLVNSAPETLDTLNELASALGNDPNFATTIATQIGNKANSSDVYNKSETDTLLSDLAKTSDLATVATSGSYNDLLDKPASFDVDLSNYYTKSEIYNLLSNYYTKKQIDIMFNNAGSDKYGMIITADESEGGDDTQGGLSFWNAVERAPGYDGTSQMNIAEDSNTVEDE